MRSPQMLKALLIWAFQISIFVSTKLKSEPFLVPWSPSCAKLVPFEHGVQHMRAPSWPTLNVSS